MAAESPSNRAVELEIQPPVTPKTFEGLTVASPGTTAAWERELSRGRHSKGSGDGSFRHDSNASADTQSTGSRQARLPRTSYHPLVQRKTPQSPSRMHEIARGTSRSDRSADGSGDMSRDGSGESTRAVDVDRESPDFLSYSDDRAAVLGRRRSAGTPTSAHIDRLVSGEAAAGSDGSAELEAALSPAAMRRRTGSRSRSRSRSGSGSASAGSVGGSGSGSGRDRSDVRREAFASLAVKNASSGLASGSTTSSKQSSKVHGGAVSSQTLSSGGGRSGQASRHSSTTGSGRSLSLWNTSKVRLLGTLLRVATPVGGNEHDLHDLIDQTSGVIDPDSTTAVGWSWVMLIGVLAAAVVGPLGAVLPVLEYGSGDLWLVTLIMIIVDVIFMLDIVLVLRTGVVIDGNKVMRRDLIKMHHFYSAAFWVKMLAAMPLAAAPLMRPTHFGEAPASLLGILYSADLVKLLRLPYVPHHFGEAEMSPHTNATVIRVGKLMVYVILLAHFTACGWLGFVYRDGFAEEFDDHGWLPPVELTEMSFSHMYGRVLYFGVGSLSGTIHGVTPGSRLQSLFSQAMSLSGLLMSAYIIGSVRHLVERIDVNRAQFLAKLNHTNHFMKYHGLPEELRESVIAYHKFMWTQYKGFDEEDVLRDLPYNLRQQVSQHVTFGTLAKVPIFKGCPEEFSLSLVPRLKSVMFPRGAVVVQQGDSDTQMFVVRSGRLVVQIAHGHEPTQVQTVRTLGSADFFGETAILASWEARIEAEARGLSPVETANLISEYATRSSSVIALTVSHLYSLSDSDLRDVMEVFPKARAIFVRNAHRIWGEFHLSSGRDGSPHTVRTAHSGVHEGQDDLSASASSLDSVSTIDVAAVLRHNCVAPLRRALACGQPSRQAANIKPILLGPSLPLRRRWAGIVLAAIAYNAFFVPFRLSICPNGCGSMFTALDALADVVYAIDIFIRMYSDDDHDGVTERRLSTIRSEYLGGDFRLDIIASVPIDWLLRLAGLGHGAEFLASVARVGKLLKLAIAPRLFEEWTYAGSRYGVYRLVKLCTVLLYAAHIVGCSYFAVAESEGFSDGVNDNGWLPTQAVEALPTIDRYLRAMHFALTPTGSARDLSPPAGVAAWFSLIAVVFGMLIKAYVIGALGSVINNTDLNVQEFRLRKEQADTFCKAISLSPDLRLRVLNSFDCWWATHHGAEPADICRGLPDALRAEIMSQLCGPLLRGVPTLSDAPPELIRAMCIHLRLEALPQGEYVFRENEIGEHMYVVSRGLLDIFVTASEPSTDSSAPVVERVKTIGPGSIFGEGAYATRKRSASVQSRTACELFSMSLLKLKELLVPFSDIEKRLLRLGARRIARVRQLARRSARGSLGPHRDGRIAPFTVVPMLIKAARKFKALARRSSSTSPVSRVVPSNASTESQGWQHRSWRTVPTTAIDAALLRVIGEPGGCRPEYTLPSSGVEVRDILNSPTQSSVGSPGSGPTSGASPQYAFGPSPRGRAANVQGRRQALPTIEDNSDGTVGRVRHAGSSTTEEDATSPVGSRQVSPRETSNRGPTHVATPQRQPPLPGAPWSEEGASERKAGGDGTDVSPRITRVAVVHGEGRTDTSSPSVLLDVSRRLASGVSSALSPDSTTRTGGAATLSSARLAGRFTPIDDVSASPPRVVELSSSKDFDEPEAQLPGAAAPLEKSQRTPVHVRASRRRLAPPT